MDSNLINLILSALGVGIAAGGQEAINDTVRGAYRSLKAHIQQKFSREPNEQEARLILEKYEEEPETWKEPLRKVLIRVNADQDEEIVKIAQKLQSLAQLQSGIKYQTNFNAPVFGPVIGDNANVHQYFTSKKDEVAEGKKSLEQGQKALLRSDYVSAKQNLENAIDMLNEDELPNEMARTRYFLALAQLNGRRPFVQTHLVMRSVEGLLNSAIQLHQRSSYYLTLGLFKLDFAQHNGLSNLEREAYELIERASQIASTPEDIENLKLLSYCQNSLVQDYLNP